MWPHVVAICYCASLKGVILSISMPHNLPHILIHQGYICWNTGRSPLSRDSELSALILILAVKRTQSRKITVQATLRNLILLLLSNLISNIKILRRNVASGDCIELTDVCT